MKILVYGATSAIAQAIIRKCIREEANTLEFVLIARTEERLKAVTDDVLARGAKCRYSVTADLANSGTTTNLTRDILDRFGPFDLVLIAHGYLPDQEQTALAEDLQEKNFQLNAMSYILIMSIVARAMRARGNGTIVVISSVAGDRGRASNYAYGSAKGAVSLFSQGLRNSLSGTGVNLLTVKPGLIDTPMTAQFANKGPIWSSPQRVAEDTYRAVRRGRSIIYSPWYWQPIMWVIRMIPEAIFKRLSL